MEKSEGWVREYEEEGGLWGGGVVWNRCVEGVEIRYGVSRWGESILRVWEGLGDGGGWEDRGEGEVTRLWYRGV